MPSLVAKDTSGVFTSRLPSEAGPEDLSRRTRHCRLFPLPDAPDGRKRWALGHFGGPVHYRLDPFSTSEPYQEIDLTISPTPGMGWDAACESNGYQVRVWQSRTVGTNTYRYIAQFRRAGESLSMAPMALVWMNSAGEKQVIGRPVAGIAPTVDNDAYTVGWPHCFGPGLHFRYNLTADRFYKTLIVRRRSDLPAPTIGSAGLRLVVVMALSWSGGARPANGFAAANPPADLGGTDDDATALPDEEMVDPGDFAFEDVSFRELFWHRKPRSWDSAGGETGPHEFAVQHRLRRRGGNVYGLFGVRASDLNDAGTVWPVYLDTDISEEQVGASADDATTYGTTHPGTANASLVATTGTMGATTTNFYSAGVRWQTIPIPQGSTIDTATVKVYSCDAIAIMGDSTWYGEDVDDAVVFHNTTHRVGVESWAARTTAGVQWAPVAWVNSNWYTSPEFKTIVQEIVSRGGWASNNDLILFTTPTSTSLPGANAYCNFRLWDQIGNVSGPKFNCSYTAGGPVALAGTADAVATAVAVPSVLRRIGGVIASTSTAQASVRLYRRLLATVTAISATQSIMRVLRRVPATATATSTAVGTLTIPGQYVNVPLLGDGYS